MTGLLIKKRKHYNRVDINSTKCVVALMVPLPINRHNDYMTTILHMTVNHKVT